MISKLFGTDSIIDLFSSPAFWIGVAIVVVIIALIVCAFKYPKIGGPMLLGVTILGFVALTAYCAFNLNAYYSAEGGIRGKITGIFETNKVEVVDNMAFKFENIELKELSIGTYSASITLDEVLSIDTKNNLGVFVNGMPCDVTSSVHKDYAIAYYVYTFYDENETQILTDTLTLTLAFYENSTTLKISTNGTTEAIKLWHYYFNKNGFVVSIAPFDYVNSGLTGGNGDVSNYVSVTFVIDGSAYTEYYLKGSEILLASVPVDENLGIPDEKFIGWKLNDKIYTGYYLLTESVTFTAVFEPFVLNGEFKVDIGSPILVYSFTFSIVDGEFIELVENYTSGGHSVYFVEYSSGNISFDYSVFIKEYRLKFKYSLLVDNFVVIENLSTSDIYITKIK